MKEAAKMKEKLIEDFADLAHEQWNGWMKYMFNKSSYNEDGSITIPKELVDRWTRQMNTAYFDLPEEEKKSDRVEARKMLEVLENYERS